MSNLQTHDQILTEQSIEDDSGNIGAAKLSTSSFRIKPGALFTVGENSYSSTWNFDVGGMHMEMPQSKGGEPSGGYGSIKIFTNDTHDATLQGTVALVPSATPEDRHIRIECIEQGTAFRNVSLNPSGGNVGVGKVRAACKLEVSEYANNQGYVETISIDGGNLANNWERGITFTGNNRGLEVGQISCWLSGVERQIRIKTNNGLPAASFDNTTNPGHTRFILYDADSGTMKRVFVGAADSGGAGYKMLRVVN